VPGGGSAARHEIGTDGRALVGNCPDQTSHAFLHLGGQGKQTVFQPLGPMSGRDGARHASSNQQAHQNHPAKTAPSRRTAATAGGSGDTFAYDLLATLDTHQTRFEHFHS